MIDVRAATVADAAAVSTLLGQLGYDACLKWWPSGSAGLPRPDSIRFSSPATGPAASA